MSNHMKTHHKCEECQKMYKTEGTLKIHMTKVHEKYVCTICGKAVQTIQKANHIWQHKTEEEFEEGLEKGRVFNNKIIRE